MDLISPAWVDAVDELCLYLPKQLFSVLHQLKKAGDILPIRLLTRPHSQTSLPAEDLKMWIENQMPELNSPYIWLDGSNLLSRTARAHKVLLVMNILVTAGFRLKEDEWIVSQFKVCLKHLIRANHYEHYKRPLTPIVSVRLLETCTETKMIDFCEAMGLVDAHFSYQERCLCFFSLTGWAIEAGSNSPAGVLLALNCYTTMSTVCYNWGAIPEKAHMFAVKLEELARFLRVMSEKEGLDPCLPTSFSTPTGVNDIWTKKGLAEYGVHVIY